MDKSSREDNRNGKRAAFAASLYLPIERFAEHPRGSVG